MRDDSERLRDLLETIERLEKSINQLLNNYPQTNTDKDIILIFQYLI